MAKYRLLLSYDGTAYVGWQRQPNGVSIQELIEAALSRILKQEMQITGAGRTDSGVHAMGQVAHFVYEGELDAGLLRRGLNGTLPHAIRVKAVEQVADDFHACRSATEKEYHYHLWLGETLDPFYRLYRHQIRWKIDFELLQEAANQFVGTHDFCSFANHGGSAITSIRTIHRISVVEQDGGVRLEFVGNGFLYKMVRNIVGTLLEVAAGKRKVDEIKTMLEARDRRVVGVAAPARGLFLVKVTY